MGGEVSDAVIVHDVEHRFPAMRQRHLIVLDGLLQVVVNIHI